MSQIPLPATPAPASPGAASPGAASPGAEPLHGCVRCGARIPVSESMCERCNPLGLKAPAASQAHGTVFIGIALAVVALAVLARLAVAGVGPFEASVGAVAPDPAGLRVTITLTNAGDAAGRTTCRVSDPTIRGIGPEAAFVQSPEVAAGASVTFDAVVTSLGDRPRALAAACGS